jgi:hypothetical protein
MTTPEQLPQEQAERLLHKFGMVALAHGRPRLRNEPPFVGLVALNGLPEATKQRFPPIEDIVPYFTLRVLDRYTNPDSIACSAIFSRFAPAASTGKFNHNAWMLQYDFEEPSTDPVRIVPALTGTRMRLAVPTPHKINDPEGRLLDELFEDQRGTNIAIPKGTPGSKDTPAYPVSPTEATQLLDMATNIPRLIMRADA